MKNRIYIMNQTFHHANSTYNSITQHMGLQQSKKEHKFPKKKKNLFEVLKNFEKYVHMGILPLHQNRTMSSLWEPRHQKAIIQAIQQQTTYKFISIYKAMTPPTSTKPNNTNKYSQNKTHYQQTHIKQNAQIKQE